MYWLFANKKARHIASSFDELFLYFTDDFINRKWIEHPMNPIVSDVRQSRPAGKLFERNGTWFRPAQDSGKRYGHRIKLQKILEWDDHNYREVTEEILEPDWTEGLIGTHTYNFTENWVVMDSFER